MAIWLRNFLTNKFFGGAFRGFATGRLACDVLAWAVVGSISPCSPCSFTMLTDWDVNTCERSFWNSSRTATGIATPRLGIPSLGLCLEGQNLKGLKQQQQQVNSTQTKQKTKHPAQTKFLTGTTLPEVMLRKNVSCHETVLKAVKQVDKGLKALGCVEI